MKKTSRDLIANKLVDAFLKDKIIAPLPSKFTKENAPIPTNSDVKISTIEEGFFAVIEYSGRASDNNFFKHKEILNKKLLEDKVIIKGPPIRATYNGPFTLPMMRRNEAMFKVEWSK